MPELGESVTEGTVTRWLKEIGDTVALGGVLASIGDAGEQADDPKPGQDGPAFVVPEPDEPEPPRPVEPVERERPRPVPQVTPGRASQALAAGGAPPRTAVPSAGTTEPLSRLRQIIAQRMTESLATSAQLTTVQEVDVTRIARLRAAAKADFERREGVRLTFLPFLAKAVVEALGAFPSVNASISDDGKTVTYHGAVHLAIAVDTPRGLLVPVIRDAQDLGIAGLARKIADAAERTRTNTIGAGELSGGTFTITNIGSVGPLFDTPIINQPQVAILATGAIYRRPAVASSACDPSTGAMSAGW